jgi:protocatechuate 3,4-dioxygenase beta subunit
MRLFSSGRIGFLSLAFQAFAWLLCLLLQADAALAQQTGSIEGSVISEPSGQPLAYAHVKLAGPGKTQVNRADADSSGHFLFENLEPGEYQISASKPGYSAATKSCDAEQQSQPSNQTTNGPARKFSDAAKISIGEGQNINDVQLELLAPGVITGTVYDQHGEPLQRAEVEAVQRTAFEGRRTFGNGESTETNDRGEYRIFGLKPGKYFIRITRVFLGGPRQPDEAPTEFVPTYYPDTTDPQLASLIMVKAGEEASGMDLTAKPTGTLSLKGRVVNGITGEAFDDAFTVVELLDPADPDRMGHMIHGFPAESTFAANGWKPGTYVFNSQSAKPVDHHEWSGSQRVDLDGSNADEVVIRMFPDVELHGLVEIPEGSKLDVRDLTISLTSREGVIDFHRGTAEAKADGSFTLEHVAVGAYEVEIYPLPDGSFVKSVRQGRTDALETGVNISSGVAPEPLTIVLGSKAAEINGMVHTSDEKPACSGMVILIPDKAGRFSQGTYPEARIKDDGHFTLSGIPPGAYKAFAWEDALNIAYRDSSEMKAYESLGTSVQVSEGDKKSIDLLWIREPAAAH